MPLDVIDESLPAITVDGAGRVLSCNEQARFLLGDGKVAIVGRDLFRDVAPATNMPSFYGRFVEGVRTGGLDETFDFMLGSEIGSLSLRIGMQESGQAGIYRIVLDLLARMPPSHQREAMLAIDRRSRAEPVDPSICEREPIHIPGTIQSHGILFAASLPDLVISAVSENARTLFAGHARDLLTAPLDAVMPAVQMRRLRQDLADSTLSRDRPSQRDRICLGAERRPFDVVVHLADGVLIVELEPAPVTPTDFAVVTMAGIRDAASRMRLAPDLAAVVGGVARDIRRMTGFERVLIYRFDREWNGEAVAEDRVADWSDSLLGLHFPASDIPRQARELYRRSPSRFVVDRDCTPVPLLALDQGSNRPLDLSRAQFRSLSPVHLEYQRNLGVNGSMSVSILMDGALWGLVIGHHRRPHYVPAETRDAVVLLTEMLGPRLHELETQMSWREQRHHLLTQTKLLEQMASGGRFETALLEGAVSLLDLFSATGAAVVVGAVVQTVGSTPDHDQVRTLAEWLRQHAEAGPTFGTDHLGGLHPPAMLYHETASGLLCAFIDQGRRDLILWFKPEVVSTVVWGGDPSKPVLADTRTAAVLPRRSFERWVEERTGYSTHWPAWQADIAQTLTRPIEGVIRRHNRQIADLSAKQAELVAALGEKDALLTQKDLLTREIDHRVKNSLQIVSAFLQLQGQILTDPAAKQALADSWARVTSVARVHDSLYQSADIQEVDLGNTLETLCHDLSVMAGQGRPVLLEAEAGVMVPYRTAVALSLIATELITNALKYAYSSESEGDVRISITARPSGGVCLSVADRGNGLPDDWEDRPRKGLGMRLIHAMLRQIGATLEVERTGGARFTVRA